jgi:hypothetical protein
MTMKKLDVIIKNSLLAFIFFSVFNITNCYAGGVLGRLIGGEADDSSVGRVSVGDSYGGGTVFCVSQTQPNGLCYPNQCVTEGSGDCGLIMANEDQVNFDSNPEHGVTWASKDDAIPGARSDDDGAANTAAIIAALPEDTSDNNAAWLCHNYQGGGNKDWYLLSKNELNKMYLFASANNLIGKGCSGSRDGGVQCLVGGYDEQWNAYWSSTESSGNYCVAWSQGFWYGIQTNDYKIDDYFGVRAVRAFNDLAIQQFKQAMQTMALGMHVRVGKSSPVNLLNQPELQEIAKHLGQAMKISSFM